MTIWKPPPGCAPPLTFRCREAVLARTNYYHKYQCTRRAVIFEKVAGHRGRLGFCKQHSTAAKGQRAAGSLARWEAKKTRNAHRWTKTALAHDAFDAVAMMPEHTARVAKCLMLWRKIQRWTKGNS